MAKISIDEERALQWITKVNNEIMRVEQLLQSVSKECEAQPEEDDTIMKNMMNLGEKLNSHWNSLCKGFKNAGETIDKAIKEIGKAGDESANMVKNLINHIP